MYINAYYNHQMKEKFSSTVVSFLVFSSALLNAQDATVDFSISDPKDILDAMTYEDKAYMVMGNRNNPYMKYVGVGSTWACERLGIPPAIVCDGPAGMRMKPVRDNDSTRTYYCTAFPTATSLAATWNTELVEQTGAAMGNEVLEYGADMLLAPAVNIHRNPLCGRNFEYYSEDPLLSGKMGAAMVRGIQSNGVGTSLKHFAANNQETNRKNSNSVVSQRALREIYLRSFEIVVKEARPWAVMSSYNKLNGLYTSQNKELLTTVLRDEWGYDGVVMTDWVCGDDAVAQIKAGNDLIMPGFPTHHARYHHTELVSALEDRILSENVVDRSIGRIFEMLKKTPRYKGYVYSSAPDLAAHDEIARQAAEEAIVMLENRGNTLPLKKKRRIALFGKTSYDFITGGTGSGEVYYEKAVSLKDALADAGFILSSAIDEFYMEFLDGIRSETKGSTKYVVTNAPEPEVGIEMIRGEAARNDVAVITLGRLSGEGADRRSEEYFALAGNERKLISDVCREFHAVGKKVIVVLNIGGVIETASWKSMPDAVIHAWQTGQQGGTAVASVLSGRANPSGHLPVSFPITYEDVPSSASFPGVPKEKPVNVFYNEGIYVGYRYYTTAGVPVSYPFGYGLSYTDFKYSDLRLEGDVASGSMKVHVTVRNTGRTSGKDVVQLYISAPSDDMDKPLRELKGFVKTGNLRPGESETVSFDVDCMSLASFVSGVSAWIADDGMYKVEIGKSSEDIQCSAEFVLQDEILVEQLHDVLYPDAPLKDQMSVSGTRLKDLTPYGKFHDLDYEFNWHW